MPQLPRSQPGYRLSRGAVREGSAREGRCGLRLDRWRYTEAVVPRLEGRRPSRRCHPARSAGRDRAAPCVGRDDEARGRGRRARQNRATAGRGDDTTRRRDRVRAPGCGPGLEGDRWESVAQWVGGGKTQVTRQGSASCGLGSPLLRYCRARVHCEEEVMTPAEAKNEQIIRQAYQIAEAKNLKGWV